MIQQKTSPWHTPDWQKCLQDTLTTPEMVAQALDLTDDHLKTMHEAHALFPIKIPRNLLARIESGNIHDPVLRQFMTQPQETQAVAGYITDPLREKEANPVPGLLHKFTHRVLLTLTQHCAVHCRYCFRRHFDYASNTPSRQNWQTAIEYIAADNKIEEVIFSGGDPLSLPDLILKEFLSRLADIPHVNTIRFHSRVPVIIPQRITDAFLDAITHEKLNTVMVLHCNHPNEIDENVKLAAKLMKQRGITLLNQAVLLHGVNDSVDTQIALNQTLFNAGILPYYLHVFDPVAGAHHFDVNDKKAITLMADVRNRLPGYCVPRLVREVPGEGAKVILG